MSLLTLPRAGIPLVDSGGYVAKEWYRYFHDLNARVGGVMGSSTDDLTLSQFEDAGIEELKAALYKATDDAGQYTPLVIPDAVEQLSVEVETLRAQVYELTKSIEGLMQGVDA